MRIRSLFASGATLCVLFHLGSGACAQDWVPANAPSVHWQAVASSADGTTLVAVAYYTNGVVPGDIYTSTDGGTNWTQTGFVHENWVAVAASMDGTHFVAVSEYTNETLGIAGQIYTSADPRAQCRLAFGGLLGRRQESGGRHRLRLPRGNLHLP